MPTPCQTRRPRTLGIWRFGVPVGQGEWRSGGYGSEESGESRLVVSGHRQQQFLQFTGGES